MKKTLALAIAATLTIAATSAFASNMNATNALNPNIELTHQGKDTLSIKKQIVYFDFNSASLHDMAMKKLDVLAQGYRDGQVYIIGYADNVGSEKNNIIVSKERAEAVAKYLESKGIPSNKVIVMAKGDLDPIATNKTKVGRSHNRRAVITIEQKMSVPIVAKQEKKQYFAKYYNEVASLPSFSLGAPSGLSAGWGTVFAGATATTNSTTNKNLDGGMSFGFGLGNMYKSVGATVTLGLASVNPNDLNDDFGNAGYYSLGLAHFFEKEQIGLGAGMSNFAGWTANGKAIGAPSYYVAATKVFSIPYHPVIATFGLGTQNYADYRGSNLNEPFPFASVGYYIAPQLSYIVDYTAGVTSTGLSVVPWYNLPLSFNAGFYDIFRYVPGHDKVSLMFGMSTGFTF